MSILIKGMEMPKSCNDCWFYEDSRCLLFSYGVPNRYNYDALTMPDWCELIELLPHGRLIDADALSDECVPEPTVIAEMLFRKLNNAPTIIEAEGEDDV